MNLRSILLGATVTAVLVLGGGAAAHAVTPPEGGSWNYGVSGLYTYSNYLHDARVHKATACGAGCATTGWVSPGTWANARTASALGGNTAYYDVR
ncbi:lactococcin 972 family bacteriocin [Plantibacter flavus]|uniref:lactococcin 972 family bacteriocin n=1 Tax=Plantibacter flavus TaxID=150123 RepID=UPI003F186704